MPKKATIQAPVREMQDSDATEMDWFLLEQFSKMLFNDPHYELTTRPAALQPVLVTTTKNTKHKRR